MKPPIRLAPAQARIAEALLRQLDSRVAQNIADSIEIREQIGQVMRMLRVAPPQLKPDDADTGCRLLPAWNSTVGRALVRVVDMRDVHPNTALAKFFQEFDAKFEDQKAANHALGMIIGRLAASGQSFGGYLVQLGGQLGNVNQWECCPLNVGEDAPTVP